MVTPMMKLSDINRKDEGRLGQIKNRFTQFVAGNLEHNNNTMDVNVPSVKWALLLVQS